MKAGTNCMVRSLLGGAATNTNVGDLQMSAHSDRRSAFPSLVEALRLLPDIRPVCERDRLGEVKHEASRAGSRTAYVNGVSVTLQELDELFLDGEGGSPRVSPAGAGLLLRLFSRGAFESADYSRAVE